MSPANDQHDALTLLNPPAVPSLLDLHEPPTSAHLPINAGMNISGSSTIPAKTRGLLEQRRNPPTSRELAVSTDRTQGGSFVDLQIIRVHSPCHHISVQDRSRIKAHAMRQVHERRRTSKKGPLWALAGQATQRSTELQIQRPKTHADTNGNPSSQGTGAPLAISSPFERTSQGVTLVCVHCGLSRFPRNHDSDYFDIEYDGLPNAPLAESFDVFATTLAPITHRVHELLNHYLEIVAPVLNPPLYGTTNKSVAAFTLIDILRGMVNDEGCMHAIVADAAWEISARRLKNNELEEAARSQREAGFHFFEAVKFLQRRLENSKEALSCSTIVTSCHLAGVAVGYTLGAFAYQDVDGERIPQTKGGKEQFAAHHNGIIRMVQMRGGIDTLPRQAAYHVSKGDGLMAWMRNKPPFLPLFRSRFYRGGKLTAEAKTMIQTFRKSTVDDHLQEFLGEHLAGVEDCLQNLTQLVELNSHSPRRVTSAMREFGEDTYAKVQHNIVSFSISPRDVNVSPHGHRQDAWRVAALIYLNSAIRRAPSKYLLQSMTARLVAALQSSDMATLWGSHRTVLFWVLFIGYLGSNGQTEQIWFAVKIHQVVQAEGFQTLGEMRTVLRRFLYRDNMYDRLLKDLCGAHLDMPLPSCP
ncbi:hypothetical protein PV08_05362 [Exophiala spinifera]|uniref:Uncharacterized protein n=1 Tax=Exophiala spinifera TaxID=91928 RepID=A0A0D1ZR80_9EURO|nr:uncharacterized protein PV08_05362 [Exophiala spinifera]KIW15317.1 hypothetical protein PV08_05362 [Exophiala spinifera]